MPVTVIAPIVTQEKSAKPDFGNGRYSPLMEEVYHDSMTVFGLESAKAEKLAHNIANELGAIMSSRPVEVRLGKVNKDGKLTISEACKLKGFTMTNPIYALKALHYAGESGINGFSFANTKWSPSKGLNDYLSSL